VNKSINYDDNNQINNNDISSIFNFPLILKENKSKDYNNFSFLNKSDSLDMNKKNNFPNQKDNSENNINYLLNLLELDIPPIPKVNIDEFIINDYLNNSNDPIIIRKKKRIKRIKKSLRPLDYNNKSKRNKINNSIINTNSNKTNIYLGKKEDVIAKKD